MKKTKLKKIKISKLIRWYDWKARMCHEIKTFDVAGAYKFMNEYPDWWF